MLSRQKCPAAWIPLGNRYNNANEIDSECGHNSAAFGGRGDGPICGKRCTCNFAYTSGSNPMLAGSTTYGVCKDPTANTEHCAVDKLACDSGDSFTPAIQDTDGKCTCLNTPTGACLDASGDFLHCAVLADSCSSGTTFSSAKQFLATGGTTKCNLCVDTWNVAFCFSGMATVETLDGVVNMKDLKVGDKVKIGQSTFDEVYMFGHHAPQEKARFVAVHTSSKSTTRPLELSRDHMIFMADGNAVPAGILKKGDEILLGNGQTTKITKVTQINSEGVFAPFTRSGKIVVNNVLASSYVTLQRDSGFVTMGAIKTPITHQAVSHTFMTPLRILSWFVSLEQYNDVGLNLWLAYPMRIANWWLDIKNMLFQAVLFFPFGAYMLLANSWCVALCLLMLVSRKSNVNVRLGSAAAGDAALKKSQ